MGVVVHRGPWRFLRDEEVAEDSDTHVGRALGGFRRGWWREEWELEEPTDSLLDAKRVIVFRYAARSPDAG